MNPRHEQAAERIIKIEGLTFALASLTGKEIPTARAMLKDAICKALAAEVERCAKRAERAGCGKPGCVKCVGGGVAADIREQL